MRITGVQTFIVGNPWKNWLFARLETDQDGLYGIGEGTLNAFAKSAEAVIHELTPRFVGTDPFQVETIIQRMTRDLYSEGGQLHMNAVAAIEVACWDIIGKVTGRPIYDLIGGRYHESLPAYANGWYAGDRTPESFAERASEVVTRGYKALKFDPFGHNWRMMTLAERHLSVDIVRAVREAVGPDVQLMIEVHSRFSVAEAIYVGQQIAEYEPTWFEEPTGHQNIASTVEVARHLNIPVASGESLSSPQQFAELLSHDAVHILQPEPGAMGGIWRTRQVAAMADAHYAVVAPHNAQGPISTATCIQISAACPNLLVQEIFDEYNVEWERDLVDRPAEVIDGRIQIPNRPGLGVDLNWSELEKHPYEVTNFLPLFAPGWERREGERPPKEGPSVRKTGA
ncbi:MAG TPA: mandelate racemase/muconate lactonizing enzyme family protein [Thermomicrobiales bacterium]|nr:mandelate racemase/muconate lactonizing enzyme family protein [Thermomicrobiales bacterium]